MEKVRKTTRNCRNKTSCLD